MNLIRSQAETAKSKGKTGKTDQESLADSQQAHAFNEGSNASSASQSTREARPGEPEPQHSSGEGTDQPETLQLSETEIQFMQEISFLIGDSPRTIKRYINMYRIIRTHSLFEIDGVDQKEDYFAAMFLLSVVTGLPESAMEIFEKIRSMDDNDHFSSFNKTYQPIAIANPDRIRILFNKIKGGENNSIAKLGNIKLSKFKRNMELVGRFSFRNI